MCVFAMCTATCMMQSISLIVPQHDNDNTDPLAGYRLDEAPLVEFTENT